MEAIVGASEDVDVDALLRFFFGPVCTEMVGIVREIDHYFYLFDDTLFERMLEETYALLPSKQVAHERFRHDEQTKKKCKRLSFMYMKKSSFRLLRSVRYMTLRCV